MVLLVAGAGALIYLLTQNNQTAQNQTETPAPESNLEQSVSSQDGHYQYTIADRNTLDQFTVESETSKEIELDQFFPEPHDSYIIATMPQSGDHLVILGLKGRTPNHQIVINPNAEDQEMLLASLPAQMLREDGVIKELILIRFMGEGLILGLQSERNQREYPNITEEERELIASADPHAYRNATPIIFNLEDTEMTYQNWPTDWCAAPV